MLQMAAATLALAVAISIPVAAAKKTQKASEISPKTATQISKQGVPLNADLTVQGNVTVQAVLIPRKIAKAVFGGKIANEYAVVELTITNKSSDAALIVQGVYLDYSKWALAGGSLTNEKCTEEDSSDSKSKFEKCTKTTQVASEEYRVVRGQALNAQTWTLRNVIIHGLILGGTAATGYGFTVHGTKYPQAVSAATGEVIPGLSAFWPDQTIDQINRISDLGFRTNKVISKQGSDIIVCFFPIDRFLTPGFRKIFLDYPALFFSPYELLVDWTAITSPGRFHLKPHLNPQDLAVVLGQGKSGPTLKKLAEDLPCYLQYTKQRKILEQEKEEQKKQQKKGQASGQAAGASPAAAGQANEQGASNSPSTWSQLIEQKQQKIIRDCSTVLKPNVILALDALGSISLNSIHVVIDGVMSVNTTALPAQIESISIDNGTNADTWNGTKDKPKTLTGTIKGAYLTGGMPVIQDADKRGISSIAAISDGSDDQTLHFSFKLASTIKDQTNLTFFVQKQPADSKAAPVTSAPFVYQVKYAPSPQIDSVDFDKSTDWSDTTKPKTGTIVGSNLSGGTPNIDQSQVAKYGIKNLKGVAAGSTDTQLKISLTIGKKIDPGTILKFTVTTQKNGQALVSNESDCKIPKAAAQPVAAAKSTNAPR